MDLKDITQTCFGQDELRNASKRICWLNVNATEEFKHAVRSLDRSFF